MLGTLLNAGAVICGSLIGLLIHRKLPERIMNTALHGVGLFTLALGIMMAMKTSHLVIIIASIVSGGVIGEIIDLDKRLHLFGDWLKKKIKTSNNRFSEGFITAFLLYCMGSMTILGAFEEGIQGTFHLFAAKSILDGFSSIALAATIGVGVLFSFIPLVLFQGGLTLFAANMQSFFTDVMIDEMTAVGGIILLGLGISILDIKKIKSINLLPSLIIVVIATYYLI